MPRVTSSSKLIETSSYFNVMWGIRIISSNKSLTFLSFQRFKPTNKRLKSWISPGNFSRRLDYWSLPEFDGRRKRRSIRKGTHRQQHRRAHHHHWQILHSPSNLIKWIIKKLFLKSHNKIFLKVFEQPSNIILCKYFSKFSFHVTHDGAEKLLRTEINFPRLKNYKFKV